MSYAQRKELSGNRTMAIIHRRHPPVRARLRHRHGTRLQRHQEGRRGPEDLRRGGAAAAPRGAAAAAQGHAEGSAAADGAAAAGSDGNAAAADPGDGIADPPPIRAGGGCAAAPPAAAAAAKSAVGDRAPRATCRTLFSGDDYPASAQATGAEGTAQATLTIGPDGRVTGCNVIRSSGNGSLDSATCNILRRRAKFVPARDSNGNADDRYDYDAADYVAPRRLITNRLNKQQKFRRKAQSCKQHPPQVLTPMA